MLFDPSTLLIDVRTPSEYADGHIPGAINIPLFTDHERAVVGTAYKQVSPQHAMDLGLQIVGPKHFSYVEQLRTSIVQRPSSFDLRPSEPEGQTLPDEGRRTPDVDGRRTPDAGRRWTPDAGRLTLYCWRGGLRSSSMAWLFRTAGYDVDVIRGGYKAYRRNVIEALEAPWKLAVIGGRTGAGKTRVLHTLHDAGEQVLDLEGIAHHKGSAFGALNQPPQPTTEQAMNDMLTVLSTFDRGRVVFVEDESLRIGTVALHPPFFERLRAAPVLVLDVPREVRAEYLAKDYGEASNEDLKDCFIRIERKLGGDRVHRALEAIDAGDRVTAADVALDYYDRTYSYGLTLRQPEQITVLSSSHELSSDAILARCRMWVQDLAESP